MPRNNAVIKYLDGITVRTQNKRISVIDSKRPDSDIVIHIRAALPKEELKFDGNIIIKGRVKHTAFALTEDAANSLWYALGAHLKNKRSKK